MKSKTTTQTNPTDAKTAAKPAQSASVILRAAGSVLTLLAVRTAAGGATTVSTKQGKEKAVRGMTEQHKTFEAAKARLSVLTKEAQAAGWVRGEFRGGTAKADAFTSMLAAPA